MKYALNAVDATAKKELIEIAKQNLSKELGDKVVTIADSLREEGFKKGIQEGVQQGMQQGEFRLFLALLKRKFAHVPKKYMGLLQNADENSFLHWGERMIYATSLKDVFGV
jgi:flagellar biosynthesis/type III secretory pathway protein FliH